ncbi:MAG: hypothetical protein Q9198_000085 [Flavoplaca austrocitrina]
MPAATRGSKGITAPRVPFVPTAAPEQSRQPTTKKKSSTAATATKKVKSAAAKAASGTKANTSKPRVRETAADKTATGRVTKKPTTSKTKKTPTKKAPKTVNKREPTLMDKVVGVKDKIVGTLEGKPGKKVRRMIRVIQAAGTKKMQGTDGKGATRAKKS